MKVPNIDLPRIVIIGAGFAGLNLARKIDSNFYQIVVIDQNNYHTFQPLLYQVATAGLEPDSIAYPIRKTLRDKKHVHVRWAKAEKINSDDKEVLTSIGSIRYDYLIVATGADSNFFGMTLEKDSLTMKSLTEALDLRSKILQNFEAALSVESIEEQERLMSFVIVGAGPTGVELAGALAELKNKILPKDFPDLDLRKMNIHLVENSDQVLANMSLNASTKSLASLKKIGVCVWLNTRVLEYDGKTIQTNGKVDLNAETLIWAAGVKGKAPKGISINAPGGRIQVDSTNAVEGIESVYAAGDIAFMTSEEYPKGFPMLASVAMQQGYRLAKNFNQLGKRKKAFTPFKYSDKGSMATIGRNLAVADFPGLKLSGILAWFSWMFVHLMLLVGYRNRVVVFVNWAWNYFSYDNGNRLIVRRFLKKQ